MKHDFTFSTSMPPLYLYISHSPPSSYISRSEMKRRGSRVLAQPLDATVLKKTQCLRARCFCLCVCVCETQVQPLRQLSWHLTKGLGCLRATLCMHACLPVCICLCAHKCLCVRVYACVHVAVTHVKRRCVWGIHNGCSACRTQECTAP